VSIDDHCIVQIFDIRPRWLRKFERLLATVQIGLARLPSTDGERLHYVGPRCNSRAAPLKQIPGKINYPVLHYFALLPNPARFTKPSADVAAVRMWSANAGVNARQCVAANLLL
jgi:hypothetical protein